MLANHVALMPICAMRLFIHEENWPLKSVFRIARGAKTEARVISVTLIDNNAVHGRGECVPYARYNETPLSVIAQIEAVREEIENGITIDQLQTLMPAGAARNAVDCALWDLMAKRSGKRVWELANFAPPTPQTTFYTISIDSHQNMIDAAIKAKQYPRLKIKIGGDCDVPVIAQIHNARPDAAIIVDANESLSENGFQNLTKIARANNVELVEQPFREGQDCALLRLASPVTICADESFHTSQDVENTVAKYDAINIKLDKTGGFTEALKAIYEARAAGQKIMFGCMVGTSLVTAPAVILASLCDWVDLDGPLLLQNDRKECLDINGAIIAPPSPEVWG